MSPSVTPVRKMSLQNMRFSWGQIVRSRTKAFVRKVVTSVVSMRLTRGTSGHFCAVGAIPKKNI
ncbi:conserved hypothetical protein [Ricinus communis]|uniref:Uncharacterized protein n=1 Tax=Ricinus communis TaxID=3988 RepID=B9TES4_RICCO|nr:conserved hypothetical protein [Ricinus communis]